MANGTSQEHIEVSVARKIIQVMQPGMWPYLAIYRNRRLDLIDKNATNITTHNIDQDKMFCYVLLPSLKSG